MAPTPKPPPILGKIGFIELSTDGGKTWQRLSNATLPTISEIEAAYRSALAERRWYVVPVTAAELVNLLPAAPKPARTQPSYTQLAAFAKANKRRMTR